MSRDWGHLRADVGLPVTLGELADWAGAELADNARELPVGGLAGDSRAVAEGDLFIALTGSRVDGHDYLDRVVGRAAAALVSRPRRDLELIQLVVEDVRRALLAVGAGFRDRRPDLRVIGVTGSVGKTSTKDYLGRIMLDHAPTLVTTGNLNTEIGVPLTLARLTDEHRFAVLEMGMQWSGEIASLARSARPEIGVITAVGPAHLEFFSSVRQIARAKAELLETLPSDGFAVLPVGEYLDYLRAFAPCPVITFGLTEGHCRAEGLRPLHRGSSFELVWEPPPSLGFKPLRRTVELPRPGAHQVLSALRTAATALIAGVPSQRVVDGLSDAELTPQRGDVVKKGSLTILADSYNANPMSMEAALRTLAGLPAERRLVVLGDMLELGPAAPELHREIGRLAARLGMNVLIGVGGFAEELAAGARDSGMSRVYAVQTPEEAAELLNELLRPGDALLAKASNALRLDQLTDHLPAL